MLLVLQLEVGVQPIVVAAPILQASIETRNHSGRTPRVGDSASGSCFQVQTAFLGTPPGRFSRRSESSTCTLFRRYDPQVVEVVQQHP